MGEPAAAAGSPPPSPSRLQGSPLRRGLPVAINDISGVSCARGREGRTASIPAPPPRTPLPRRADLPVGAGPSRLPPVPCGRERSGGEAKRVLTLHRHAEDLRQPLDSPFGSERGALHHFIGPGLGGTGGQGRAGGAPGPALGAQPCPCRCRCRWRPGRGAAAVPARAARLPFIPLRGARLTSPPAGGRGRGGPIPARPAA